MKDRETKILKNSLIFTIGNLGSKVFSYAMVLVYTHYISSSELGYYDIVLTTISLLQPIIMLSFDEGIYRWLIDSKIEDRKRIISTCIKTVLFSSLIALIVFAGLNLSLRLQYVVGIILLFFSSMIYHLILNIVRGLSNNKLYALSGIVNSLFLLIFEVVGIIGLKMGIEALILSKVLANFVTLFLLYMLQPELRGVFRYPADRALAKDITRYTVPLIPNSISWWIVNSSDRYIILFLLGQTFNGIYTVSNKFPTVISTISSILYLALQESVIKEYNSADRDAFYSKVFEKYYTFLFSLVLCGVPLTKLVILHFVGREYIIAWQYMPFLFLATVFGALSSFLGIGYMISKDTKRSAYTTVASAVVNIGLNVLLINYIGLHAASLSTLVSYMFLFTIRIHDCKKYFSLIIKWRRFIGILLFSTISMIITFIGKSLLLIVVFIVGFGFFVITNKNLMNKFFHKLMKPK